MYWRPRSLLKEPVSPLLEKNVSDVFLTTEGEMWKLEVLEQLDTLSTSTVE